MPRPVLLEPSAKFASRDGVPLIPSGTAHRIERALSVRLPDDFTHMCEYYKDAAIEAPVVACFSAEPGSDNVVTLTQALRSEMGLPAHYATLEVTDDHVLLLTCAHHHCATGQVLKIPRASLAAFVVGHHPPDILSWPSCVHYFSEANSRAARHAGGHA
jgi:hypothetical protein